MEEMIISIDSLSINSVTIIKQNVITATDGKKYQVGMNWAKGYANSISGRKALNEEVKEPYLSVILLMWGDTPTIIDDLKTVSQ